MAGTRGEEGEGRGRVQEERLGKGGERERARDVEGVRGDGERGGGQVAPSQFEDVT